MKLSMMAYKEQLLLTSLMIVLPALLDGVLLQQLDALCFYFLVTHWLLMFFVLCDRANAEQHPRVLALVFWVMPVTSLVSSSVQHLVEIGLDSYTVLMVVLLLSFGLLFLICGNLFPKIRQNSTIGIRVKWTLENEDNWNATHRFGGKVWVGGGLLCMICALFPDSDVTLLLFIVVVLVLAFLPMWYSYHFYRKQLAAGTVTASPVSRKGVIAVAVFIVAILAFIGWTLFTGDLTITCGNDALEITTSKWKDRIIPYDDITDVTYYAQEPSANGGTRTKGFGNLRYALGSFENDRYGSYTRYTHTDCDACITMDVNGQPLVINAQDPSATKELYNQLMDNVG